MERERMLLEKGTRIVGRASDARIISNMMGFYQVNDNAVAEALRLLRARGMDDTTRHNAVMELTLKQWPRRFPARFAAPASAPTPVQP